MFQFGMLDLRPNHNFITASFHLPTDASCSPVRVCGQQSVATCNVEQHMISILSDGDFSLLVRDGLRTGQPKFQNFRRSDRWFQLRTELPFEAPVHTRARLGKHFAMCHWAPNCVFCCRVITRSESSTPVFHHLLIPVPGTSNEKIIWFLAFHNPKKENIPFGIESTREPSSDHDALNHQKITG